MFKLVTVCEFITHCENTLNKLEAINTGDNLYDKGFIDGKIKVYEDLICFLTKNKIYDEHVTEDLYYEDVCECGVFHCKDFDKHSNADTKGV